MKLKYLIIQSICLLLLFSCTTREHQVRNEKSIRSTWSGSFNSDYHSDGTIITWVLFNDGTMTGKWRTQNDSTIIDFHGTYSLTGNDIIFQGSGTSLIRSNTKTKVQISGEGLVKKMHANGLFKIDIEHPRSPSDKGTWILERI